MSRMCHAWLNDSFASGMGDLGDNYVEDCEKFCGQVNDQGPFNPPAILGVKMAGYEIL